MSVRRVDGLFSHTNFFACGTLESRRLNGSLVDSDVLSVTLVETGRLDGGLVHTDVLTIAWLEARRINTDFLVDTDVLAVGWLETRSQFTFSDVNLSIVTSATGDVNFDVSSGASLIRSIKEE